MIDNQYHIFRNIDRRCTAGGLDGDECRKAVQLKRVSIESDRFRDNPIVQEVIAKKTTFVAAYNSYSHAFRGVRRFLPLRHGDDWNQRLHHLGHILPNVKHFMRRSIFALDNPITGLAYGLVAAAGMALVLARAARGDGDPMEEAAGLTVGDQIASADGATGQSTLYLVVLFGVGGFLAGTFALLKYRTRDSRVIRAKEAAAYMDLNYDLYRAGDDDAWARFLLKKREGGAVSERAGPQG